MRLQAESDWGVGITGIAGPGGGTELKPVGTVHIAVSNGESTHHKRRVLPFGRARNREISAYTALDMIRRF